MSNYDREEIEKILLTMNIIAINPEKLEKE
jgi:hypothetical protein